MASDRPLEGRVALVTGASRGIGAATASAFAAAGCAVVLAARESVDLRRVAADLGALAVPTDIRDPVQVRALVGQAVAAHGTLDVVVASAGLGVFGPVGDLTPEAWDRAMDVNLKGTFLTCQAALPYLLANPRGGHVFTLASIAATRAFPNAAAYCASKWGVLGFTRVLAEEVRRQGVRVTAVLPGSVDSPFWDAAGGTDLPRDQMLHPADVAAAIVAIAAQPPTVYTDEITLMPPAGVL